MTIFYQVNGEHKCTDLSRETVNKLGTMENLLKFLKKYYNTENVIIDGVGEA